MNVWLLPLFSPFIQQGEISNLPAFNFYAKLSAVHAQEPLSGQTILLDSDGSDEVAQAVIEHSRDVYATKQEEIVQDDAKNTANTLASKPTSQDQVSIKKTSKTKRKLVTQTKSNQSKTNPPGY